MWIILNIYQYALFYFYLNDKNVFFTFVEAEIIGVCIKMMAWLLMLDLGGVSHLRNLGLEKGQSRILGYIGDEKSDK